MKQNLLFLLMTFASFASAQLNMTLKSHMPYEERLSDIWGYNAPDGREYALVGTLTGLSIVDITDTENPVEKVFIPGQNTIWRDIKTWENHAYVTNEEGGGLLVVDLSGLPDNLTAEDWYYWNPSTPAIDACHNIFVDEFGFAYLTGCDGNEGGPIFVDVFTDPHNPIHIGYGQALYSHDCFVRDNILYDANIYEGYFSISDVSDKLAPVVINTQNTPFDFTHNVWLSDDSNTIFTTDERANAPIASYDISDPNNIEMLDEFRPLATINTDVLPHNVFVWENWLIISYYTDGAIVVDATHPDNLIEVGNFDTFLGGDSGGGAWGVYPYFDSGTIVVSDIGNGLSVLEPNYVQACYLEGTITDASTGIPISGVNIDITSPDLNAESSNLSGVYKTGQVTAGAFDVTFSKIGYISQTINTSLVNGEITILDVQLVAEPTYAIDGQITNIANGIGIANVQVELIGAEISYTTTTDIEGNVSIEVLEGEYNILVGLWGFTTTQSNVNIPEEANFSLELEQRYEDDFAMDLGWENIADNATTSGFWERDEPIGTFQGNQAVNPEFDLNNDLGNKCYITGNGGGGIGNDDVDGGTVWLYSPPMDLSTYISPILTYSSWFVNTGGSAPINDALTVIISNGETQVILENIAGFQDEWIESTFILADFIPITDSMQLIFETSDLNPDWHVVEAGVDGFKVTDAAVATHEFQNNYSLTTFPNPFSQHITITYELDNVEKDAFLIINNILGQELMTIPLNNTSGTVILGERLEKGVYFVQIKTSEGKQSAPIKIVKQ